MSDDYELPKVWTWQRGDSGSGANALNRPVAGPTHETQLPVGKHPLQLYSMATPNGAKAAIMLEELLALGHAGAEYDAHMIKIGDGDQFGSGFVSINPNSKIPALVDRSVKPHFTLFESGSILLYLAEKFDALIPSEPALRAQCMNWVFWQVGARRQLAAALAIFTISLQ